MGGDGTGPGVAEAVVDVSCNPSSSAPPGIVPTEPVAIVPGAAGAGGRAAFHASPFPALRHLTPKPETLAPGTLIRDGDGGERRRRRRRGERTPHPPHPTSWKKKKKNSK